MAKTFLYFAYGSNMLRERLLLQNPSAKFVTTALLKNYQLTFTSLNMDPSKLPWKGGAADIRKTTGQSVCGCVWRIDNKHKQTLDRQESLHTAVEVKVTGSDDVDYVCQVYQILDEKSKMASTTDNRPSPFYMDVIIKGAQQSGICEEYVKVLKNIEHSGAAEPPEVYLETMKMINAAGGQ